MTIEDRAEQAYGPAAGLARWYQEEKARAVIRIAAAIREARDEAIAEEREACALVADRRVAEEDRGREQAADRGQETAALYILNP